MTEPTVNDAVGYLRSNTTGTLRFDENARPVKYVFAPDGRLVISVMEAMLLAVDTVLFAPDYTDECMEIMVTLERFDEDGPHGSLADRWRIYHGDPEDVRWALGDIEALRYCGAVFDGQHVQIPNPLAGDEAALCKWMNLERNPDLARLARQFAGMDVESPRMVGIDPSGIDIRRQFDVIHVPATEAMVDVESAKRILRTMMDLAREREA